MLLLLRPSKTRHRKYHLDLSGSKKLAIVGPTGAGKVRLSTCWSVLWPVSGRILVNGYDLKDIKTASLRAHMSTVLQDSFLFPMSVRTYPVWEEGRVWRWGHPGRENGRAHDFIMRLPGGYDYVLQEGSSNVSIGQRQLISFARSLLMNPKLLILDEATSSIDPYTELVIQNALKNLLKNRMAIIIAHRLSTIRLCDEILVSTKGRLSRKALMSNSWRWTDFTAHSTDAI